MSAASGRPNNAKLSKTMFLFCLILLFHFFGDSVEILCFYFVWLYFSIFSGTRSKFCVSILFDFTFPFFGDSVEVLCFYFVWFLLFHLFGDSVEILCFYFVWFYCSMFSGIFVSFVCFVSIFQNLISISNLNLTLRLRPKSTCGHHRSIAVATVVFRIGSSVTRV